MKRKIILVTVIAVIIVACLCFTSCDAFQKTPKKLSIPSVSVSNKDGIAVWNEVPNAVEYKYVIDDRTPISTKTCSVQLSDGESIKVMAVGDGVNYLDSGYSLSIEYRARHSQTEPTKLETPSVVISSSGVASWSKVTGAVKYKYVIDDNAPVETAVLSVTLSDGESIKVMALGDGEDYVNSDYSAVKTYIKGREPQLAAPSVTISENGAASWQAVVNAVKYRYVIDRKPAVETQNTSVTLNNGESIKVMAVGDGINYLDSDYSAVKTYVAKSECIHTDADDNGVCDGCGNSVLEKIDFYALNDLHGKFMDTSNQPGVDELSTYFKERYADNASHEIVLSSGDMWQGTVESSTNRGRLMTDWMNALSFVSMTLGNHEYDWGNDGLDDIAAMAEFPLLGINVRVNGVLPSYCKSSVVVRRGNVNIGIIGAIGNCLSSISGEYTSNLNFITGDALTNLVKEESERLRNEEDCKMVVYSIHDGYPDSLNEITNVSGPISTENYTYYDTSLSNGYVDLVFEGHTHQRYILKDEYGVYHLQASGENRAMSLAKVTVNTVTSTVSVNPQIVSNSVYGDSSIADDPVVNEIFNKYFPDENPYTTTVGYNSSTKNDNAICEQVAELYLKKGKEYWSNYNVVLGGGYLKARSPYNIYSGNVTYSQIFSVMPFDNTIVLGSIKGSYLKSKFINSTNSAYHCAYDPSLTSSISDSATYYIVVDTYTSSYRANNITEVARITGLYPRDLLKAFIAEGGWDERGGTTPDPDNPDNPPKPDDPQQTIYTAAEINAIASALADNTETEELYYYKGTIKSVSNTTYGNMTVTDEEGNDLYIYGCYKGGVRYDSLTDKPVAGDVVILYGKLKKYVKSSGSVTIEMINAQIVS